MTKQTVNKRLKNVVYRFFMGVFGLMDTFFMFL